MPKSDTATMINMAAVGGQFMDIMDDYMKLQDTDDFDVQFHLMDLYTDLSTLYYNNEPNTQ